MQKITTGSDMASQWAATSEDHIEITGRSMVAVQSSQVRKRDGVGGAGETC
jgi:hypothetical protein